MRAVGVTVVAMCDFFSLGMIFDVIVAMRFDFGMLLIIVVVILALGMFSMAMIVKAPMIAHLNWRILTENRQHGGHSIPGNGAEAVIDLKR